MDEFTVLIASLMACIVVFGLGCISIYLGHQRKLEAEKNARIIAVEEEKTNRARVAAGREYVNAQLEAGVFNQSQTPPDEGGLGNLMQYLPMILPLLQQKQGQIPAQQGVTPFPAVTLEGILEHPAVKRMIGEYLGNLTLGGKFRLLKSILR